MSETLESAVKAVCSECGNDRERMMDIVRAIQGKFGCVSSEAMDMIAKQLATHRVEVESVVSFYSFLSDRPKGKVVIRLCDDIIDEMAGSADVANAFATELGIGIGETTADGKITLEHTPCIGMCDQVPAAMVNDVVVTNLTPAKVKDIVAKLKADVDADLVDAPGDGNNANDLVKAMVQNNIQQSGDVIFAGMEPGAAIKKALEMAPKDVIAEVTKSKLRGRGGAGFPTGLKWKFTSDAPGAEKFVLCNADEGEPGTFKDRVILTEQPDMMFEGMTVAGYAIDASTGVVYLRAEYAYLREYLESVLARRRSDGLLGKSVCGKDGFDFDIRIQMGAGAYICGEETALISSCEGLRGDPKNRPPFPAQEGYKAGPTTVNNVETFCCCARVMEKGADWFAGIGDGQSVGTKLLSISGDCGKPGIYEVPFGITVDEMLKMCGAKDTAAVQVGGASGQMIGKNDFGRKICYDDLATGGSIMIFNSKRDLLKVAEKFMEFFVDESCGYCTPCRAGNVLLLNALKTILAGKGEASDLEYIETLGNTVIKASRCGLGQTSPNPILTTLKNFRPAYEALLVAPSKDGYQVSFDIKAAVGDAAAIAGRDSVHAY
ncbi:MAG: NAD(P)H-dependent oxidoreductase subunit E [Phycisphaerae bacterium]|nr:NAD(P)H-dependent oxidoreductase subunit E [Phycisphaerae bacterium]